MGAIWFGALFSIITNYLFHTYSSHSLTIEIHLNFASKQGNNTLSQVSDPSGLMHIGVCGCLWEHRREHSLACSQITCLLILVCP